MRVLEERSLAVIQCLVSEFNVLTFYTGLD